MAEAVRSTALTTVDLYVDRKEVGGLETDRVKRLTDLGEEDERVRKALSGLAPEKLILGEAASGTEGPRPRNV